LGPVQFAIRPWPRALISKRVLMERGIANGCWGREDEAGGACLEPRNALRQCLGSSPRITIVLRPAEFHRVTASVTDARRSHVALVRCRETKAQKRRRINVYRLFLAGGMTVSFARTLSCSSAWLLPHPLSSTGLGYRSCRQAASRLWRLRKWGRSSIGYKTRCTFRIALLKLALCLSAEMLLNGIVGSRPPPRGIGAMVKVAGQFVYFFGSASVIHLSELVAWRQCSSNSE
jgi:hypothetical protein